MKLDSSVKNKYPELTIGYAVARNVKVERIVSELEKEKRRVIDEVRDEFASVPILEISEIKQYREFYKSMNVDPTKIRPALIDGRNVTPAVGEVLLRDDEKILTAYTLGDAKTTMVTPQTENLLMVAWNAPGITRQRVEDALNAAIDYAKRFCQATVEKSEILP